MCEGFAKREFYPVSENDITCYLYHSLIAYERMPINSVHTEYTISEGKQIDIVLGRNPLQIETIDVPLLVEIKLRKQHIDYYLDNYRRLRIPSSFYEDDVEKLIAFKAFGAGVAAVFFQKLPPSPTFKQKSENEILRYWEELEISMAELEEKLKKEGIRILYGPLLEFYKAG